MPRAEIVPRCKRHEPIDDIRQIPGKQLRLQEGKELAGIDGPLASQHHTRCIKRLPGRASPGSNEQPQGLKGGRVRCICGKLNEAVDKNRAEQLRRAPCRIDNLTGGPRILSVRRAAPGISMINTVESITEVADDVSLASKELTAALAIATVSVARCALSSRSPGGLLSDAPLHNGGQCRH